MTRLMWLADTPTRLATLVNRPVKKILVARIMLTLDLRDIEVPAKSGFYEQVTLVKGFSPVFVFIGLLFLF
jgi:hypothetical protein